MRNWRKWTIWSACVIGIWGISTSRLLGDSPLNADKLIVSLRPEHPTDRDFLTYTAALMEAGYLPRSLVESTFLWAREKPNHQARYFREGLIRRAEANGIDLPTGPPPMEGTVEGQVVYLVKMGLLKISMPVSYATVRLADRRTTANIQGKFSFPNVPLGQYTVRAEGSVAWATRKGSLQVRLPTRPPSTEPVTVTIYVQ